MTPDSSLPYDIAASIVAYNSHPEIINKAIESFLNTELSVHLLVIDNSSTDYLRDELIKDHRVTYHFNSENTGFSKAHNQGISFFRNKCNYFLVLNPDVYFDGSVLRNLYDFMQSHPNVGVVAPRVLYPSGKEQISRRLIPSPVDLFIRRFPLIYKLFADHVQRSQYEDVDSRQVLEVPFLLGCFLFTRMTALEKVGYFDERYFVYMEDLDLCRRINKCYKVVYYGKTKIFHLYQRASSKNIRMFALHTVSMVKYFNKWGWMSDAERKRINRKASAKKATFIKEKQLQQQNDMALELATSY